MAFTMKQMQQVQKVGGARRAFAPARPSRAAVKVQAAASDMDFKTMREGIKIAADETLLTPRL